MLAIARTTTLPYRCVQQIQQQFTTLCQKAPTPSAQGVTYTLGLPFSISFDSLAPVLFNWLRARVEVSCDTSATISIEHLLIKASQSYRGFTIIPEVNVFVLIVTYLSVFKSLPSFSSPVNLCGCNGSLQGGGR